MKEAQAMSQRLSAERRFTPTIIVVAVLGIMALVSLPWGVAGEGDNIAQKVRDAKTPADHQAIAAVFAKEAQAAQQEAKLHTQLKDAYAAKLKDAYAAKPDMQMMVSHCDMLVKHYQEIAKDLETIAKMHKKMGEMGRW
jgi:ribosomal protein S15P/S13E